MSSLQLGLIVAGVLLVIGVIIFNAWQERRVKRRIAAAFRKDDQPRAASGHTGDRLEPTLGNARAPDRDAALAAQRPLEQVPAEAFAIPMDELAPSAGNADDALSVADDVYSPAPATVQNASLTAASAQAGRGIDAHGGAGKPDPDIECIIVLQPVKPMVAGTLAAGLHARLGKSLRWFGRSATGAAWQPLDKDTSGVFIEFAACMLLADRNGAVSRSQLDTFVRVVGEIAASLPAAFGAPAVDDELARADVLDRLCADLDIQIGLTVVKPDTASVAGTRLRGVAEAAGFRLSAAGRFELVHDDTAAVLYTLQNLRSEPFTAESLRLTTTNGVVFVLDVPRVSDPARVFDQMKLAAKRLAVTLDGQLVDDNKRPLDDAALARIREQVAAAAQALRAAHIEPGSARALALFGA